MSVTEYKKVHKKGKVLYTYIKVCKLYNYDFYI